MAAGNPTGQAEQRLANVLREDIRRGDFKRSLRRDWNDLKDFYLDDDRRSRLRQMGALKRFFVSAWWLLKSLFLKLTPIRRLLVILGLLVMLQSGTCTWRGERFVIQNDTGKIGFVILLFVLMLELKDKLIAQSELQDGRSVQHALMPERSPQVPGWELWLFTRPANEVGGDWVDFLKIEENRFAVTLGDVAGKGLKAALLMAKLQATLRALAADYPSLAELGGKLNAIYRRDGLVSSFASLVYIEIPSGSGNLRLLNAGHLPPILLTRSGIAEITQRSAAIGVLADTAYLEQSIDLQAGEALIVYSDGVTEAENETGDFFGEQRLLSLLSSLSGFSAQRIGERVVEEVDRFVSDAKMHDDVSLMIIRRAV